LKTAWRQVKVHLIKSDFQRVREVFFFLSIFELFFCKKNTS